MKEAVRNIARTLPEGVKRPIRKLVDRMRGLRTNPLTHAEIARLVGRPDPVILEIGCNDGSDTLAFLQVMPAARMYCFEPDPRAIARFKAKVGLPRDNVSLYEVALSDRRGTIDFHASNGEGQPGGWDQSGSIRRPKNHIAAYPAVTFDKVLQVATLRLDDWCADTGIDRIDFVWMDVQGAEGDVIAGGLKSLRNARYLYTEFSNDELYDGQPALRDLRALLPSFRVVARFPGDVLLKNRALD